jgi:N-acylneuraminate cytidylyltransferase
MRFLCIIPARRDSKGIPGKNWKPLNGKPLIGYSIETALACESIDTICVSTNSKDCIEIAQNQYQLTVPFTRPEEISLDTTPSHDVLIHAIEYYENQNESFDAIVLLQPTSPYREVKFLSECIQTFIENSNCDMVVSVNETHFNPYYNLYNETDGFIHRSIPSNYTRRQDCPPTYVVNGSIYVISIDSIKKQPLHSFEKVKKYIIPEKYGLDLDTLEDWAKAELIFANK